MRVGRWLWPGRASAALAFGLGAVVALGQVPFGLHLLALAAISGLFWLLAREASAPRAFAIGLWAGAGHFALALNWIVQPFFVDPWTHGWMAPFAVIFLSFGLALLWAAAAALAARLTSPGAWRLLALVAGFALADLARGHILTGFPWALFGHIVLGTPVEQWAALIGGYGLGTAVLALAALPVLAPRAGTAAALVLLAGAVFWGYQRQGLEAGPAPGGVVRIVQPAIAQSLKWDPVEARANFDLLFDLSRTKPAGAEPDVILWPETAVPFLIEEGTGAALTIGSLPAPVAAGYQRVEPSGERAWNALAIFGPGGSISQSYDKIHLVPFGEYIPFGDLVYRLTGLRAFAAQQGFGYTAGDAVRLVDFGARLGPARVLICYEAIFPEEFAGSGAENERPEWILQITNDAWFGTLTGPYQHFAQARLRAIEQGLPLVRVANTGVSAVVSATGQVMPDVTGAPAYADMGERAVMDVALPGSLPMPLYARIGDWPLLFLLLAGLGLATLKGRRSNIT